VADAFKEGDTIVVSAISKAKGFQGVVKRHNFAGGPRTHGQKHSEREPGAIGGGGRAGGRVAKGIRMAGRMGNERVTVKNLKIIKIDTEKNLLFIGGAVPGRRGTRLLIKTA
jgi:large subunit ribosomal protein L3